MSSPAPRPSTRRPDVAEIDALVEGTHSDPHRFLGPHQAGDATLVRAYHPTAKTAAVAHVGAVVDMERIDDRGVFEARIPVANLAGYRLRLGDGDRTWEIDDPYRFWPTIGELDLHLIGEGHHLQLWTRLGARVIEHQGVRGTAVALWAPRERCR